MGTRKILSLLSLGVAVLMTATSCSLVSNDVSKTKSNEKKVLSCKDTSEKHPAQLGNWVKFSVKNYDSRSLSEAEMHISKITTETENKEYVNDLVNKYNSTVIGEKFSKIEDCPDVEYVVADVESKLTSKGILEGLIGSPIPESFGVVTNEKFATYKSNDGYNKIFSTDVVVYCDDYNTYKYNDVGSKKIIYSMVKGNTDYSIVFYDIKDFEGTSYRNGYLGVK